LERAAYKPGRKIVAVWRKGHSYKLALVVGDLHNCLVRGQQSFAELEKQVAACSSWHSCVAAAAIAEVVAEVREPGGWIVHPSNHSPWELVGDRVGKGEEEDCLQLLENLDLVVLGSSSRESTFGGPCGCYFAQKAKASEEHRW
jgi:hypothetical protein